MPLIKTFDKPVLDHICRGAIFGDQRFEEGETIRTSTIIYIDEINHIIKTENSTYNYEIIGTNYTSTC